MPEYINAENFRNWLLKQRRLSKNYTLMMLDEQPTADVQEVVRCKDCKYRYTLECSMYWESDDHTEQYSWENDDDYCSYGERKD